MEGFPVSVTKWQQCVDNESDLYQDYDNDISRKLEDLAVGDKITIQSPLNRNLEIHVIRSGKYYGVQQTYNKKTKKVDQNQTQKIRCVEITWVSESDDTKMSPENIKTFENAEPGNFSNPVLVKIGEWEYHFIRNTDDTGFLVSPKQETARAPNFGQLRREIFALNPTNKGNNPNFVEIHNEPNDKNNNNNNGQVLNDDDILLAFSSLDNNDNSKNQGNNNDKNDENNGSSFLDMFFGNKNNDKKEEKEEKDDKKNDAIDEISFTVSIEDMYKPENTQLNNNGHDNGHGNRDGDGDGNKIDGTMKNDDKVGKGNESDDLVLDDIGGFTDAGDKPNKKTNQNKNTTKKKITTQEEKEREEYESKRVELNEKDTAETDLSGLVLDPQLIWQYYDFASEKWEEVTQEWYSILEQTQIGYYCQKLWQNMYQIQRIDSSFAEAEVPKLKINNFEIPELVVNVPFRRICIDTTRNATDSKVFLAKRRVVFRHTGTSERYETMLKTKPKYAMNNKKFEKSKKYNSKHNSKFTEYCDFDSELIRKLSLMEVNGPNLVENSDLRKVTFQRRSKKQYFGLIKHNLNFLNDMDNNNNNNNNNEPMDGDREVPTGANNNNNNNNNGQRGGGQYVQNPGYMKDFDNKLAFTLEFIDDQMVIDAGYIDPRVYLNSIESDLARDVMWKGWKFRMYSFTDPEFAFVFAVSLSDFITDVTFICLDYYDTETLKGLAIMFVLLPLIAFLLTHGHLDTIALNFLNYSVEMVSNTISLKTDRTEWLRNRSTTDGNTTKNTIISTWRRMNWEPTPVRLPNGKLVKYPRCNHLIIKLISTIFQLAVVIIIGLIALSVFIIVIIIYAIAYIFDSLAVIIAIIVNFVKYLFGLIITIFILVYLKGGAWKYVSRFYLFSFCGEQSVYFEWAFGEREYLVKHGYLRNNDASCQCGGDLNAHEDNATEIVSTTGRAGSIDGVAAPADASPVRASGDFGNGAVEGPNSKDNDYADEQHNNLVRMLNVAIVCEVMVESVPQLILLSINQWALNNDKIDNADERFLFWFSWFTSLFMILNLGYAFSVNVIVGGLTWSEALNVPVYPVNE